MGRAFGTLLLGLVFPCLVLPAPGCSREAGERSSAGSGGTASGGSAAAGAPPAGDPARGRQLYLANCTSCHSTDPTEPGPVGPPIAGSPRALVEARVLHASYPPGYTPKRSSNVMPPLPHLAKAVPDIAAYLGSLAAR